MICPDCGHNNSDRATFCVICGAQLAGGESVFVAPSKEKEEAPGQAAQTLRDDRYVILKVLGEGGMGRVYLAKDTKMDYVIVIKEMLPYFMSPAEKEYIEKRFKEEAKLLFRLDYHGLPKVIDFFSDRGNLYIVMQYVEGSDLQKVAEKRPNKRIAIDECLEWMDEILDIMGYLHSQNPPIIHRDIKPRNIMLNNRGEIYLVDFGLARTIGMHTRTGTSVGTYGYSSPEHYSGKFELSSDIFSIGATFHHLLSGDDPQNRDTFDYPPLKKYIKDFPQKLQEIFDKMLAMRKSQRFQRVEFARQALDIFRKEYKLQKQAESAGIPKKAIEQMKVIPESTSVPESIPATNKKIPEPSRVIQKAEKKASPEVSTPVTPPLEIGIKKESPQEKVEEKFVIEQGKKSEQPEKKQEVKKQSSSALRDKLTKLAPPVRNKTPDELLGKKVKATTIKPSTATTPESDDDMPLVITVEDEIEEEKVKELESEKETDRFPPESQGKEDGDTPSIPITKKQAKQVLSRLEKKEEKKPEVRGKTAKIEIQKAPELKIQQPEKKKTPEKAKQPEKKEQGKPVSEKPQKKIAQPVSEKINKKAPRKAIEFRPSKKDEKLSPVVTMREKTTPEVIGKEKTTSAVIEKEKTVPETVKPESKEPPPELKEDEKKPVKEVREKKEEKKNEHSAVKSDVEKKPLAKEEVVKTPVIKPEVSKPPEGEPRVTKPPVSPVKEKKSPAPPLEEVYESDEKAPKKFPLVPVVIIAIIALLGILAVVFGGKFLGKKAKPTLSPSAVVVRPTPKKTEKPIKKPVESPKKPVKKSPEPRLVKMTIPSDSGADHITVKRNGTDVAVLSGEESKEIKPGTYDIYFIKKGYEQIEKKGVLIKSPDDLISASTELNWVETPAETPVEKTPEKTALEVTIPSGTGIDKIEFFQPGKTEPSATLTGKNSGTVEPGIYTIKFYKTGFVPLKEFNIKIEDSGSLEKTAGDLSSKWKPRTISISTNIKAKVYLKNDDTKAMIIKGEETSKDGDLFTISKKEIADGSYSITVKPVASGWKDEKSNVSISESEDSKNIKFTLEKKPISRSAYTPTPIYPPPPPKRPTVRRTTVKPYNPVTGH